MFIDLPIYTLLEHQTEQKRANSKKPFKKFMFIKTDTCALKHIIPFIKEAR
jgi:hypothetical protein